MISDCHKYFFFALIVFLGSATASEQSDTSEPHPFFSQCMQTDHPVACKLPYSMSMSCNGVYMCCPHDVDELRRYTCDGEKFIDNEIDLEDVNPGNPTDLTSQTESMTHPFFSRCIQTDHPVACRLPYSMPMSCNGVYMCCPKDVDELRRYTCDGEKFIDTNINLDDVNPGNASPTDINPRNATDLTIPTESMAFTLDAVPFSEDDSSSAATMPSRFVATAFAATSILCLNIL